MIMATYNFLANDFMGEFRSTDDCAMGRLNKREKIIDPHYLNVGLKGNIWDERLHGNIITEPNKASIWKIQHIYLNGEPISDQLDIDTFNFIKKTIIKGEFKSAEVEMVYTIY